MILFCLNSLQKWFKKYFDRTPCKSYNIQQREWHLCWHVWDGDVRGAGVSSCGKLRLEFSTVCDWLSLWLCPGGCGPGELQGLSGRAAPIGSPQAPFTWADGADAGFSELGHCFMCKTSVFMMPPLQNVFLCLCFSCSLTVHNEMKSRTVWWPWSDCIPRAWQLLG